LLKIIEDACKDVPGKTVELDLSATRLAVNGGVFDPRDSDGAPYDTGESFITKLTLPNEATTIADGGWDYRKATFAGFKGLVEVSADKVKTIEPLAFYQTRKLEKAYFRAVESIGHEAFAECPALAHLYFPGQPPALPVNGAQPNSIFLIKTPSNEDLIIHVPNGEAVDAYTDSWEVDEITDASSTTLFGGSDFLYHKRVVITAE
jgi:hypothetical protein